MKYSKNHVKYAMPRTWLGTLYGRCNLVQCGLIPLNWELRAPPDEVTARFDPSISHNMAL